MCGSLVSNISTSIKNCIRSVAALKMAFNRTTIRNLGVGQKFHNVRLAQTFDTLPACFLTSDCRWMAESMVAASLISRPRIQQQRSQCRQSAFDLFFFCNLVLCSPPLPDSPWYFASGCCPTTPCPGHLSPSFSSSFRKVEGPSSLQVMHWMAYVQPGILVV